MEAWISIMKSSRQASVLRLGALCAGLAVAVVMVMFAGVASAETGEPHGEVLVATSGSRF